MSPASKQKSKERSTPAKASKEQLKVSIKPSPVHANGGNVSSASVYNPALGTFHTLDISSSSSLAPQSSNARFRTIDDPEDHFGNSPGTTAEYDSLSNNGSCSGESEDLKDNKPVSIAPRVESIPGCDNDKRDKIRQKNERKHQRQREKRAQDLHERCNSFLTSRKLESLSHQLVAMGFPTDRATMAIIINEGRMEESVAWLLHEGEEDNNKQQTSLNFDDKSHVKVDIADELARIAEMELKYKCTKQDVERAVVAFEGDLLRAEESLKSQKQAVAAASAAVAPKSDEYTDSVGKNNNNKVTALNHSSPVLARNPVKVASSSAAIQQQKRDEKDPSCSKAVVSGTIPIQESTGRNLHQTLKKMQLKPPTDWSRDHQVSAADKRWLQAMSTAPPVSYPPLASGPPLKPEPQFPATMGSHHEVKTGGLKDPPFIVMRRPRQQNLSSSSSIDPSVSPPASNERHSPGLEMFAVPSIGFGHNNLSLPSMGSRASSALRQFYHPPNNLHSMPASGPLPSGWSGGQSLNASGTTPSSLGIPSSLGLFTGWGSSSSRPSDFSSQNDWNTGGSTARRDYTSIDWSLDLKPPPLPPRPSSRNGMLQMGGNIARIAPPLANGFQEGSDILTGPLVLPSNNSSHEWTNPFEGRDLFRVPRQYVTSSSPSIVNPNFQMEK